MHTDRKAILVLVMLTAGLASSQCLAGEVEVVDATAQRDGDSWMFSVTIRHDDAGWDHYADLWQVVAQDGEILGERELLHPHVDEQPFTRLLSGVDIPDDVTDVIIRARDNVHGFSPQEFKLSLPR